MPRHPGPFYVATLARALARRPGRTEVDHDEAHGIGVDIYEWYRRGGFAEHEVVVKYGDPPRFGPLIEAEADAKRRGCPWDDLDVGLWYATVFLTAPAARRYIEGCGLAGAPRLLREWFGVAEAKAPRTPGPQPKIREAIKAKMLADLRSGRRTVEELIADTKDVLVSEYGGSPNTAAAARKEALSEFQNSISDRP